MNFRLDWAPSGTSSISKEIALDEHGRFSVADVLSESTLELLDMVQGGGDNMVCLNVYKCS